VPAIPLAVDIGASVVALAAAIWFTRWYPAKVQRAVQAAFAAGADPA
jgi:hypothetical protein